MAISLLYPPQAAAPVAADPQLLYQLSLDRAFAVICPDRVRRERFFSVLTALSAQGDTVRYRQEVLDDLRREAGLLEQLRSLHARLDELARSQKNIGRDELRLRADGTGSQASAANILRAQALCLRRALLFVRAFDELLDSKGLTSRGLRTLGDYCRAMCERPEMDELIALCGRYADMSTVGLMDFHMTVSDEGRIAAYALIDHRYIHFTDPAQKPKGFALRRRVSEEHPCAQVLPTRGEDYESMAAAAMAELSALFATLAGDIFSAFAGLDAELDFYNVSLLYEEKLREKGAVCVVPRVSEDGVTRATALRDVQLLMTTARAEGIVPNDVMLDGGLAVFGDNGSGKTAYLRAIGSMQLLAQAGLPVPAQAAEIVPCAQLCVQFSQSESADNEAGRFEQEVRDLADMVDRLRPGALVLLNETFQSTAYTEGEQALEQLLLHFSACGIRWVLVSHLHRLASLAQTTGVRVCRMSAGFRVEDRTE